MNLKTLLLPILVTGLLHIAPVGLAGTRIDRHALVTRHNVTLHQLDVENPLTVGNGEFAFTVDATGLQTFESLFTNTIPLGTLSQWGWHMTPTTNDWSIEKFQFKEFNVNGRAVGYADVPGNRRTPEINWLRSSPHRLHLGQIGLWLTRFDGQRATAADLKNIEQTLDLWRGEIVSRFECDGEPVTVRTLCHPTRDLLAVRIESPLVARGQIGVQLHFPYGTGATVTADWTKPEAHQTSVSQASSCEARFARTLDAEGYQVHASWSQGARLSPLAAHEYVVKRGAPIAEPARHNSAIRQPVPLAGAAADRLEFVCEFTPGFSPESLPVFRNVQSAARDHWEDFWESGGAIDLSQSRDLRWRELERRIVLSQYLTAIQCSGSLPPQETGLTYNSWEGKFHLEMHWWHAAHFALWDRLPLLERSLGYYDRILNRAEATARRQGYAGARWPKMTSPSGAESPSPVGPFLIWQQPHPIFYAELCYRQSPSRATLRRFEQVVNATAEFMASYPEWSQSRGQFNLGPVLQCAQEIFPKDRTLNPTFELTYWRWALETAQQWRLRLGQNRAAHWDEILRRLAPAPQEQGKYLFAETATGTYTDKKWIDDHPSVTAALGMLPGPGIDRERMRATLHWICENWNWPDTWGWDYGMVAMTAARLGEPERAVDALLLDTPKNYYRINGHNHQRPGLTIYLPGNGSLLYATAMMCAGWDGVSKKQVAPGFPTNGQWVVRYENLRPAP